MPLSLYALDKFVSQELSQLTECRAGPVAADFPGSATWLNSFVLQTIVRIPLPDGRKALALAIIRRAQGAIEDYELGRAQLEDFIRGDRNRVSVYFRALREFESAVAMTYQAFEYMRKALGTKLFTSGDGSVLDRLNLLYNRDRHTDPETLPNGHLHAVWIRNDGLHTDGTHVTFDELRNCIRRLAGIAESLAQGKVPTS
jgi:hypothetical protein